MRYEIGDRKMVYAVIDDRGVHITANVGRKGTCFIPYEKIISVSTKKPGRIIAGNISFQTAAVVTTTSVTTSVPFKGEENYELACKIQADVESRICT